MINISGHLREENEKELMKYRLILWSGTRLSEEEENND